MGVQVTSLSVASIYNGLHHELPNSLQSANEIEFGLTNLTKPSQKIQKFDKK